MDSEGIIHFSFFFYALMKGRIATISFGCLCAVEERRNHRVYDMSGFSYDITDVVHLLQLRVRHKKFFVNGCELSILWRNKRENEC